MPSITPRPIEELPRVLRVAVKHVIEALCSGNRQNSPAVANLSAFGSPSTRHRLRLQGTAKLGTWKEVSDVKELLSKEHAWCLRHIGEVKK